MIIIKKCLQTFKLRMWFWKCKQKKLSIERVSQSNYGPSVFTFHSTNQRPVFSWDCYYCTTQLQSVRWQKTKKFFFDYFRLSGLQNAMLKVNFSTFEAVDSDCGNIKIEPNFNGRILGGQEATPHNYNWMVVLVLSFANGKIKNFQINSEYYFNFFFIHIPR